MDRRLLLGSALTTVACLSSACGDEDGAGSSQGTGTGGLPGAGNATGAGAAGVAGLGAGAAGGLPQGSGALPGAGGAGPAGGGPGAGGVGNPNSGGTPGAAGGAACDPGATETAWATGCATEKAACVPGEWIAPGSNENDPLGYESEHFAFYWPSGSDFRAAAERAADVLENTAWSTFMGPPILFPEPYCDAATKYKVSVTVREGWGLTGGGWGNGYMGMWIGPGGLDDRWGLAHEFTHALQASTRGLARSDYVGWMWESHANWHAHQLPDFRDDVHCSELLVNFPHLYLGSTRDRYCNWQFMEYLKDRYCYSAVEDIWANAPESGAEQRSADPFSILRTNMGWSMAQLNDFFGEWAMHNVTWDYRNPDGTDQGAVYRREYGATSDRAGNARGAPAGFRRLRTTSLEPLEPESRRFVTPSAWAPQRWGYNVVRLHPDAGATEVTVTFRGVVQDAPANTDFGAYDFQPATVPAPNTDFRWGLVAVDASGTKPRYGALNRGTDGAATLCIGPDDAELWLVVMATPSENQPILWDQAYYTIYRYPWMIELAGAMPDGLQPGAPDPTSSGQRWPNGGGWVASGANVAASAYVGPHATVLGGTVSDSARIDGHAVVVSGTLSGNALVDGLSVVSNGLRVRDSARVGTVFQGPGTFEPNQVVSGSAQILGDVELRGAGIDVSRGVFYGFVDPAVIDDDGQGASRTTPVREVTAPPPYVWRP